MKVDLIQEPWPGDSPARRPQPIKRMVPFLMKATGRVHRVRSARLYFHDGDAGWKGRTEHVGVSLWCGGHGFLHRHGARFDVLLHEPPDGHLICATCEGRAVGAGQPPAAWLTPPDRPLIFTPRHHPER